MPGSTGCRGAKPPSRPAVTPGTAVKTCWRVRAVCGGKQVHDFGVAPPGGFGAPGGALVSLAGGFGDIPQLHPSGLTQAAPIPPGPPPPPRAEPHLGPLHPRSCTHRAVPSPAAAEGEAAAQPCRLQHAALPAPGARRPRRARLSGVRERGAGEQECCGEGERKGGRNALGRGAARSRRRPGRTPPRPAPFGGCATCGSGCRCQLGGCVPTWRRRRRRGRRRGAGPRRADGNTDDGPQARLHLYHGESRRPAGAAGPELGAGSSGGGRRGAPLPAPEAGAAAAPRRGLSRAPPRAAVIRMRKSVEKRGFARGAVAGPGRGVSVGGGGGRRCPQPSRKGPARRRVRRRRGRGGRALPGAALRAAPGQGRPGARRRSARVLG